MDPDERERREAYARVRASLALEGMELTAEEEAALEPYFRGECSLDELTARVVEACTDQRG
jgi:hypothetical protein